MAAVQKREIYIYNLETNTQEKLLQKESPWMLYPAWSPDGKKIAFYWPRTGQQNGVYTVNRDGTELQQVTEVDARVLSLTWAPSGDELLYAKTVKINNSSQLFTVNLETRGIKQLTDERHNFDAVWFDPTPSSLSVAPSESLLTTTWGRMKNRN
jgi:TolB protein